MPVFFAEPDQARVSGAIELHDFSRELRAVYGRYLADPIQRLCDPPQTRKRASAGHPLRGEPLNGIPILIGEIRIVDIFERDPSVAWRAALCFLSVDHLDNHDTAGARSLAKKVQHDSVEAPPLPDEVGYFFGGTRPTRHRDSW
jgi:hypothetical protein